MNCSNFPISEIMTLDADIQYVGIYHNHLGNVDAELREDIASYFSDKEHVESATGTKLQMISMRAEKQPHQFQYAMAKFSDTILYAFSINEHDLLLVTTAPTANSDLIISRILDFLRH